MKIPLTKATIGSDDIEDMVSAIQAKAISQGEIVTQFEKAISDYFDTEGAVATNSGTSALILALKVLGVGPGDEVIIPSYTCLAILNAVVQSGASAQLVDSAYDVKGMDFNMIPELAYKKISSKTRAIIVPHMFGVPAEIDKIVDCGLPVVEDITLSLGAQYKNKPLGCWGDICVTSFHDSKMIACGEGGMLTSRHPHLYEKARHLNGWEDEQASVRLETGRLPPYELRFNFRMSDIAAALGISQLGKLPEFISKRRELAKRYTTFLSRHCDIITPDAETGDNLFYRYLAALKKDDITSSISAFSNRGIEAGRGVYPPLHRLLRESPESFPGADSAESSLISIPLYPDLNEEQVEYLFQACKEILN